MRELELIIESEGVGPFCKIKINKELKLKLKENVFWYFYVF